MLKMNELAKAGQSIWYDYIHRQFIESGELQSLINQGLRGITSNPSIFENAIAKSSDYDNDIRSIISMDLSDEMVYESLALKDIAMAAELLKPVYDSTRGLDGYVSIEVNPKLAHDTAGTISDAKRLFGILNRQNVMIKIPATDEGIPAITEVIGSGINVNVTLIFGVENYMAVADAYMKGLELLYHRGGRLNSVSSVASLFISRIDAAVDKEFDKIDLVSLKGKIAIANARKAYMAFEEIINSKRWLELARKGARFQRLLWASTGTKNPGYPDTMYIDELIEKNTVNTVPPATLQAWLHHGIILEAATDRFIEAEKNLNTLKSMDIDLKMITGQLQADGVDAFTTAFNNLLSAIHLKVASFKAES